MDTQTIGLIAAVVGLIATVAYLVLGAIGVKTLREIRDQHRGSRHPR